MNTVSKIIIALLFFSPMRSWAQVATGDSLALVDFYNAMNGPNWSNNTNWLIGSVASWAGISVANNRVIRICPNTFHIRGSIPGSISNLTALEEFGLGLSDSIAQLPDAIGSLLNLEKLSFSNCNLYGTIPSTIGSLSRLKRLIIYNDSITGSIPTTIGNLDSLEYLSITGNKYLTGSIPDEMGNMSNLKELYLDANNLSGSIPSTLGNLSWLVDLSLGSNELTGMLPSSLGNLSHLENIFLACNHIIGSIPPELCNCSSLTNFSVEGNDMSGFVPTCFGANLQNFMVTGNHFTGSIPAAMVKPGFFYLKIENNNFDTLPDFSQYCSDFKYFYLENNKFTFEDLEPNVCFNDINYSPQDSVLTPLDTTILLHQSITLTSLIGGSANYYWWYKNGSLLTANYNGLVQISNMSASDTGIYTCRITSTLVPDLTLWRYPIHLRLDTNGVNISGDILKENKITVYPVPAKNILTVDMEFSSENNVCIEFFDISGKALLTEKYTSVNKQQSVIDISGFAPGIYFCKVSVGSDYSYHKIMVQ